MCRLRTRPWTDVDPPQFLDLWTDSGSLFPEKLQIQADAGPSASEVTTIWRYTNVYIIIIIIP